MGKKIKLFWQALRTLSGDNAYERYLESHARRHTNEGAPGCTALSKAEFYRQRQEDKWNRLNRCC
ncbi:MAG: YbdD/YjiX family protein [Gammaproteobacteria bacterium]